MTMLLALAAPEPAETIFSLLLAGGIVAVASVVLLGSQSMRREFAAMALWLAAVVAVGATAGSLYFSEVRHFTPCELCWYQRIAMYPMALALPAVAWRRERALVPYALGACVIGGAVSLYHYQLQVFPDQGSTCDVDVPCSARWVEVFGFVSIPLLALGSFVLIALLLAVPRLAESRIEGDT